LPNKPSFVVSQDIRSQRSGPAVSDLQFSLRGNDVQTLKAASQALKTKLATYQGVSNINDDMPSGTEKLVLYLKPEATHHGVTLTQVSEQINRLLTPQTLMTLYEPNQSVEVTLGLAQSEVERWSQLSHLPITLRSGETLPLHVLAGFKPQEGFDLLSHRDGQLAVEVSATVDLEKNNARAIWQKVWADDVKAIQQTFGIEVKSSNDDNRQNQALSEMTTGLFLGLGLMILILTAVFSSYLWPWAVMMALPLGLTGAVLGHWLLGFSLGLFSLFGMFTLSGIVVNDAIILLVRYRELLKEQSFSVKALVEACCQRLRPVLLTSITTILGLLPILIDQSATARYFHATAATIVFGLMFASIWILFVIPAIVCVLESVKQACLRWVDDS
jgi:multidrug efflux pump subunit AcrB